MIKNWPIKRMKIDELMDSPTNERFIKESNYEGLKSSLRRFGGVELPVYNETTQHLVSGHQRVKGLKELGETETDVICVEFDESDESLANLTMNNPEITGSWTQNAIELARSVEADDNRLFKALNMEPLMKELNKLVPKVKIDDDCSMKLPDPDFDMICPCCHHKWLIGSSDIVTPIDGGKPDGQLPENENLNNFDIN